MTNAYNSFNRLAPPHLGKFEEFIAKKLSKEQRKTLGFPDYAYEDDELKRGICLRYDCKL